MLEESKAKELYERFQQYYWDSDLGWMPDHIETKKIVNKVIDEIENQIIINWKDVRHSLNKLYDL
jgi:hypothetical protein